MIREIGSLVGEIERAAKALDSAGTEEHVAQGQARYESAKKALDTYLAEGLAAWRANEAEELAS